MKPKDNARETVKARPEAERWIHPKGRRKHKDSHEYEEGFPDQAEPWSYLRIFIGRPNKTQHHHLHDPHDKKASVVVNS